MIINTLQANIASPLYRAALYSFEKISMCANTLFSFIREEGNAWKIFFSNNYYISKLYSAGSEATTFIAKKIFTPSNQPNNRAIELSNASLENLESSNKAWIRDHSLFHKNYPHFNVSNEALLDVIFSKDIDDGGVIKFIKKFCSHRGNSSLQQSLTDWEKAYRERQRIQQSKNRPQEMEQISRELSQRVQGLVGRRDCMVLLFEKEAIHSNSSLSHCIKDGLEQIRSTHDALYQTLYSNVKEKLQRYLDTSWKKRFFSEIQEEVRALLLDQYSSLYQQSTLGHHLPIAMQQLLSGSRGLSLPEGNESLPAVIWDLFLQNGIDEAPNQPLSMEKLNQIFEKEFEMITRGIETVAMAGINQFVENAGKDLQPLLQIWHSRLPQKERGWVEIKHQSETHCQINLCARDLTSPAIHIARYGEPSPMKMYSYNEVPKRLLETEFFFGLLYSQEGSESPISSLETRKQFFSQCGTPTESYIPSNYSTIPSQGLLDHIETYYSQANRSSIIESPEKTFFQMRLHAFINYCRSVQNSQNVTDDTLSTVENGISLLLEDASELYDAGQFLDDEYMAIIATALEIEESVIQKQPSLRESSEMIVPTIVKEPLRKAFSSSSISQVDLENIKSFAQVLLGKDMSEDIALLCKELPITNHNQNSSVPPYVPLLKIVKDLCVDIKNLRTSPIAFFRVYSDVYKLLNNARSIITVLSYSPYISILLCHTNPAIALTCIATASVALGILYTTLQLEPLLNLYISILNFHREIYTFIATRLLVRILQVADIAMHWNEIAPMQTARSFLAENISNTLSFSLHTPMDPEQESIPKEIAPLQRFYPHMQIWADMQNAREISDISFPELSMEFNIQERDGVKRAYLIEQPGFWIADVITDRKLEVMDLAHLILENERGDKKICVVPRSQERLLLQTILKMGNLYSRKSVDLFSHYLQDQMAKRESLAYYYDVVDGELTSQDFPATSYLIIHYMASNDTVRSQKLVDQVKKMKISGRLEDPSAVIQTLEQISSILPSSINSDMTKIILQLSSLCTEIPMQSKAFPLFLRAYQYYVASKERNHRSYLSEAEESSLLQHIKDNDPERQMLNVMEKLCLAAQTALPQTLLLLANTIIDGSSIPTLFGKEGYIPTSLRKYQLERNYLDGDMNTISLLIGLMINNLINPYFSLGRDMVNLKNILCKKKGNVFDILSTIISKLNGESSTVKSDYALFLCAMISFSAQKLPISTTRITESMKKGLPLLQIISSIIRDLSAAHLTSPSNAYSIEEKLGGVVQTIFAAFLNKPSSDYGIEKTPIVPYTRQLIRGSLKTVEDYLDIHSQYKKKQLLCDRYARTFLALRIGNDCEGLQALEQNILSAYQKINNTFLQRQDMGSNTNPELDVPLENSPENPIEHVINWYESGRARASNPFSYTLHSGQTRQDLMQRLKETHETLQGHTLQQAKAIEHLLTHHPRNLSLLADRVEQYTRDIRNNSTAIELAQEQMRNIYSNQSTIGKVGTSILRYINTLLEVPTFGRLQIFKNSQIQLLAQEQSHLLQESASIQSKRGQLFQNMMTALTAETSLGFNEVYTYFCRGKDASIIESLGLDDNQWKILKEQLYRYMILQKHLAVAEYITGLCTDTNRTVEENIDLIGHELDSMSASLDGLPVLEVSVRSHLQLERKLGRSISRDLRNRWSDIANSSMENFQSVYQFSRFQ